MIAMCKKFSMLVYVLALLLTFVSAEVQYTYQVSPPPHSVVVESVARGGHYVNHYSEREGVDISSRLRDIELDYYGPNVNLCELSITPASAYALPGGKVRFRSDVSGVEWNAMYGVIEEKNGYVYYTAPTVLNGSVLVDYVTASKGFCVGSANVTIEADEPTTLNLTVPARVKSGSQANIYATVRDKYGNPVSGKRVRISLSVATGVPHASLDAGDDEGLTIYSISDASGKASAVLVAGDIEANYTIVASYGNLQDSASVSVYRAADSNDTTNNTTDDNTTNNNTDNSNTTSNNDSKPSSGGSGSSKGNGGNGVYVVGVNRANESGNVSKNESNTVENKTTTPSTTATSLSYVRVSYYKAVYVGGIITLKLTSDDGMPLVGREVVVKSPSRSEKVYKSNSKGVVEIPANEEGIYTIMIKGTKGVITIKSIVKAMAATENETTETFDIVAAMTGGNPSVLPVIAALIVLLVLIVGAAVYLLQRT